MSDNNLPISSPRGYHDFVGLGKLRAQAGKDEAGTMRKVAEQFEAHFVQQMMQTMRQAVEKSDLVDSGSADMFQDMMDKEVATQMASRSSMGLADMLMRQWEMRQAPQGSGTEPGKGLPLQAPTQSMPMSDGKAQPMPLPPAARKAYQLDMPGPAPVKESRHE
jgi:Rod binding domain-containing protein